MRRPLYFTDKNLFHVWLSWAKDLGLTFEPYRDLEEKKRPTGRRDPDKKPRTYPVGYNKRYWDAIREAKGGRLP